jgi:hypothetical protein
MGRLLLTKLAAACAIFAAAPTLAAPVARPVSTAAPKAAADASAAQVIEKFRAAQRRVTQVVGHPVVFEAQDLKPQTRPIYIDAAERTAQAFEDSAVVLNGRQRTMSITRVLFVEGERPSARLEGETLRITVAARVGQNAPAHEQIFHLLATQATA